MKVLAAFALLLLGASAMRSMVPGGGLTGAKPGAGKAGADDGVRNQFPEGKVDTATGLFQKYERKDLLDSIEDTLDHLEDKLTSVETSFKTKLEAVENVASKEVRKVLEGIRAETEKLGV